MLTFKKGRYTYYEVSALYDALTDAKESIKCVSTGCETCPRKLPCSDINCTREYLWRLMQTLPKPETVILDNEEIQ